ncbi:leukocyte receptor cluster member 1 homolog [Spea bombifrons]|uniref:leukocyte receptor cluster member 1 homolog n=1 Tax=Spea bombifrons TaxID=233779 RepID=UPI00234AC76F|nr:leukocyte receptor cluster member 1 homolog [Spea bombifrons]
MCVALILLHKYSQERQEKALGILTYLGQSASEAQTSRPWYQEVPSRSKKEVDNDSKDDKWKRKLDPIHDMEKYLQKKHKVQKEHKKEKRKESKGTHKPAIEQLRHERLKREAAERARAEALLSGKKDVPAPEMDDRKRQYNSQFFPQLARKPKPRDEQNR